MPHPRKTLCNTGFLALVLVASAGKAQSLPTDYVKQALASAPQPVDECQVVARINGQIILSCELLWKVNLQIEQNGAPPPEQEEEIREQLMQRALMQIMDLRMIYADFRRNVPQADLNAIHESLSKGFEETEVPRLMKEVGVKDRNKLQARLVSLGTTIAEQREHFYKSMIARSWINEGLKFDKEVTHQQMLDYYHDHAEEYAFPTQARWEELMVQYDQFPTDRDAYVAICGLGAQGINRLRQANAATDPVFGPIAKQNSHGITAADGGLHDWTTKGALAAEKVDEAIFALPVGQMSPIIRGPQGFHIVHVLQRKDAGKTPFTKVQNDIRESIQDDRFNKAITAKLAELKSEAHVWTIYTGDLAHEEEVAAGESATRR